MMHKLLILTVICTGCSPTIAVRSEEGMNRPASWLADYSSFCPFLADLQWYWIVEASSSPVMQPNESHE